MSSPTTPPVWKVRMVSCVPGSPMDWAAMTPTASPELDDPARGQRLAVTGGAHPVLGLAREHRAHPDPVDAGVVAELGDEVVVEDRARSSMTVPSARVTSSASTRP